MSTPKLEIVYKLLETRVMALFNGNIDLGREYMDDAYREKLRVQARAYLFYLTQLSPDEQSAIWILLPRGCQKTIRLLEYIKEGPVTYEELCRECGYRSQHSVSQKLNALKEGGFPLSLESDKAWSHYGNQGRPRRVTYLNRALKLGGESVK